MGALSPSRKRKFSGSDSPSKAACVAAGNKLEALKKLTSVVADTGDFQKIKAFKPDDATTNPTLLFQAVKMPEYNDVVQLAIREAKAVLGPHSSRSSLVDEVCDQLAVQFGAKILKEVSGYVSTEVDANLSFDTQASVRKAKKIISMYQKQGIDRDRILIKLGSTWESIVACRQLEREGIKCNMTLLFSFAQAVACAEAGATLISPFVGRILDWYKNATGREGYAADEDPGVVSVRRIYKYYKHHGYKTIVMGASFRNSGEILALAGCDKLTIAPKLLEELKGMKGDLECKLNETMQPEHEEDLKKLRLDEKGFRWMMNEDQMATEKLSEGVRNFNKDLCKLKEVVMTKL